MVGVFAVLVFMVKKAWDKNGHLFDYSKEKI
jgi:hypothetical protein